MENTKRCSKCGRELPLTEFHKCKNKKDGLNTWCKECHKQYYQTNREEKLEYQNQYNAEHKEELAAYDKQYRAEHKEEKKHYNAERYATIEVYAYNIRHSNLINDRKYGRCGKDEDLLPNLDYYIWALQQRDFYDGKQYHWSEMGLDRIYNDKPHTFANVVPCSTANNKRRGRKSFEEYREYIQKEKEELELTLN